MLPEWELSMRIAVVGAGYWGTNLVRVFYELGVLYRICDFSVPRLQELGQKYPGVRLDSSYDAVLNDSAVDAVVSEEQDVVALNGEIGDPCAIESRVDVLLPAISLGLRICLTLDWSISKVIIYLSWVNPNTYDIIIH